METHIAFLRGINLGNRRLRMKELRGHLESLGLDGLSTFLASGNVLFEHEKVDPRGLEREIEEHLEGALGYPVATFVRHLPSLVEMLETEIVEEAREQGFDLHVIFLRESASTETRASLAELEGPDDRFRPLGSEVLWLRRGGLSDSPVSPRQLEKALGGPEHTMRKLNTVRRIVAKCGA